MDATCFFWHRGWTAIINDNLASNALFILVFCLGLVTAAVGAIVALVLFSITADPGNSTGSDTAAVVYAMMGFGMVVGFVVGALLASVVESAYSTIFVCIAESPYALEVSEVLGNVCCSLSAASLLR